MINCASLLAQFAHRHSFTEMSFFLNRKRNHWFQRVCEDDGEEDAGRQPGGRSAGSLPVSIDRLGKHAASSRSRVQSVKRHMHESVASCFLQACMQLVRKATHEHCSQRVVCLWLAVLSRIVTDSLTDPTPWPPIICPTIMCTFDMDINLEFARPRSEPGRGELGLVLPLFWISLSKLLLVLLWMHRGFRSRCFRDRNPCVPSVLCVAQFRDNRFSAALLFVDLSKCACVSKKQFGSWSQVRKPCSFWLQLRSVMQCSHIFQSDWCFCCGKSSRPCLHAKRTWDTHEQNVVTFDLDIPEIKTKMIVSVFSIQSSQLFIAECSTKMEMVSLVPRNSNWYVEKLWMWSAQNKVQKIDEPPHLSWKFWRWKCLRVWTLDLTA